MAFLGLEQFPTPEKFSKSYNLATLATTSLWGQSEVNQFPVEQVSTDFFVKYVWARNGTKDIFANITAAKAPVSAWCVFASDSRIDESHMDKALLLSR